MSVVDSWPHVFVAGDADTPVVLALHGTGGDEHDLLRLGQALIPGAPIVSPRGQVSEQGMNRWFRRLGEGVFDYDDVIAQADKLAEFVTEATTHYNLVGRELVAVGFSNGANIASATALLHPAVLNTVVAFSGMYPFADRDPVGDVSGVKIFLAQGTADQMAPQASGDRLEEVARKHGATITRHLRPGGHGITEDDLAGATQWLQNN
jgi:phospholipase/carboxylesterase